jgi:hypothetical protein
MRSLLTHIATFGVAGVIALGTIATASAATHHKRHAAQDEMIGQDVQLAPRNNWRAVPPASWQGPYGCVTDEGYGRYDACDVGGAS